MTTGTLKEKINNSIRLLQNYEPPEGYYLAFSGGKDSQTIYQLAKEAKVKFDAHYSLDLAPPEVKQFIKTNYPDVVWERTPGFNFYNSIVTRGFPFRKSRWCCADMKEKGGKGRTVVLGIRWQESTRRRSRKEFETTSIKNQLCPILTWTTDECFEYLDINRVNHCSLYDEGFKRLGCVLCPMMTPKNKQIELERFPKIAEAWRHAFDRLYANRKERGMKSVDRWTSGDDMFNWYLERK